MKNAKRKIRSEHLFQFLAVIGILLILNFLLQFVYFRIDLTEEKRHTLSSTSIEILENLDDVVYFRIYLQAEDLPAGFKRLQQSIKDILNEFRSIAGENIQYEFIDPFESPDLKTRGEIGRQLMKKGLNPTSIEEANAKGGVSEKLLFSGAIVSWRDQELALEFLKNNMGLSGDEKLNQSIQVLEYELIQTIVKFKAENKKRIAFIEGHGELDEIETASITQKLKELYEVERVTINEQLNALKSFDCIVIAGPNQPFSEKDKFIIDQFIMNGGKSLWLIDAVQADMDSLAAQSSFIAMGNQTNLEDQLFKYGVRINANLIQDMNCGGLKINTAPAGVQPSFRLFPWLYFPLLFSNNQHIIGKNIDLVKTEFCSTVDTIEQISQVKKDILLFSSPRSRLVNAPALINLEIINEKLEEKHFPLALLPAAVLLEGEFTSLYKNRLSPEFLDNQGIRFAENSKSTMMLVAGDANIIRNQTRKAEQIIPFELGYDRHTDMTFNGNKEFLLNVFSYMLDDNQLIDIRNREIKLRLLDKNKTTTEKLKWQMLNLLLPVIFILISGILIFFLRKRKYAVRFKSGKQ